MPRISPPRTRPNNTVSHAKTADADIDDSESADPSDDAPIGPQPVDALSEMMAGLQGAVQSRITVYRIVKNQPAHYVFECDPTSFSLDDLRDKYNGGEFRLYVTKEGKMWKNMRVFVEPRQTSLQHEPAPPTNASTELLAIMRDGFAQQAAALRDAISSRGNGGASLFSGSDLPGIITAAAAAITALRPPAPPPPSDNTSQALEMFMRGMEIAGEMRERASPADNSIGGMLRDVIRSPLMESVMKASALPPPAPPPARQPPAIATPPGPAALSHAKTPAPPQSVLSHYLGFLVEKAAAGTDHLLYAELVLDNVPDDQLAPMLERGPLLIEDLMTQHPGVAQHRVWFESLINAVSDAFSATEEDDPPPPPETIPNAADPTPPIFSGNAAP